MFRRLSAIMAIALFVAAPVSAFDRDAMKTALDELSQGIAQSAYTMNETDAASREAFNTVAAQTERREQALRSMIGGIESADDLRTALEAARDFSSGKGALEAQTTGVALQMLKERAAFLNVADFTTDAELQRAATEVASAEIDRAAASGQLLSSRQRGLVVIQMPIVEAVISVDDNKENRRIDHLKEIFSRHECKVMASHVDESGDKPMTNFYVSGRKYVIEALMRNYKGVTVANDLKAILVLTTGGFWGKKSIEVVVEPKRDAAEKGSLAWYQAVLEKDPYTWMAENDYGKLSTMGKVETVGGEQKLLLKNAKMDMWVVPAGGTRRDAIYVNSSEYGDLYVAAH
ncbi:MAG TPA: hypothetical protein VIV61_03005 [Candidatus Ozemobacteraceae bacterium]